MLDERLQLACDMFPKCEIGADIGADHGKLALQLIETNKCSLIQVTDLSEASLNKARKLFSDLNLSNRALFLCGDGFQALEKKPEAAAILGMGGNTICGIIENQSRALFCEELILSPHTDLPMVRHRLYSLGYAVRDERVAFSGGRFYVIIRAKHTNTASMELPERLAVLGPCLAQKKDEPGVHAYYLWIKKVLSVRQDRKASVWIEWINEIL